jgi:RNA polymerase sigma-70 factor (ECF subfamily)
MAEHKCDGNQTRCRKSAPDSGTILSHSSGFARQCYVESHAPGSGNQHEWLAERFEENRDHLQAVAWRLLGTFSEAEDAVQETWIRLSRSDASEVENLGGWLTTVVSRVCLDMLRARALRREEPIDEHELEPVAKQQAAIDPEQETLLADSVGIALLVVLDRLTPAERLAFVLHDIFAAPFEEIAAILGRSATSARQLASRARRRVQGRPELSPGRLTAQRRVVDAFLSALRAGDLAGILAVLDPNVVRRADAVAVRSTADREIRGAAHVANESLSHVREARFARTAMVDGDVGIVLAPRGQLFMVIRCKVRAEKIVAMDVIAEPERLRQLELSVLDDVPATRQSR